MSTNEKTLREKVVELLSTRDQFDWTELGTFSDDKAAEYAETPGRWSIPGGFGAEIAVKVNHGRMMLPEDPWVADVVMARAQVGGLILSQQYEAAHPSEADPRAMRDKALARLADALVSVGEAAREAWGSAR